MVNSENNQDLEVLAQRIARRGAVLPGTRPYWSAASRKLKAQIRDPNCKSPHLFFTVSAADIHWPDLHQHMPVHPGPPPENENEQEAYRRRAASLNDNPAIAAYYFQKRWQIFYEVVVKPQLNVVDYWWRFEWQHRGSSHIHGFLWLRDAPSVEDLKLNDDQSVHQFVTFWDHLVSTWNPKPTHPPAPAHPSSRAFSTLSDTQQELVELINRVQRHAKCSSYCLRRDKTTREEVCRFRFPQDLRDLTELIQKEGESILEFLPKRNDPLLNSYNPTWILGWRANMDFRPVLSPHAAISYISKYVSKSETQSKTYQDILRTVVGNSNDNARASIVYQKMLSSLVGERDISGEYFIHFLLLPPIPNRPLAQEVCHTLFGCPMWVSSRQYRSLKVSEGTSDEVAFVQRPNTISLYQRYIERPNEHENLSLYEFYQWFDIRSNTYKRRGAHGAKPYVVDIWPRFVGNPAEAEIYEKFCRAKIFLHHPHRSLDNLLLDSGIQNWSSFYQHCQQTCNPPHYNNPDPLPEAVEEEPDSDTESLEDSDDEELFQDAWMAEAGRAPNARVGGNISHLGQRDMDEQHPWTVSDWTEEEIAIASDWIETQKRLGGAPANQPPGVDWRLLQGEQREVFLRVVAWYKTTLRAEQNDHPEPLLINVDGTAGTGKSFLISAISTELQNLAFQQNKPNPVMRLAPTGIAAFGINGMTIHSALSLPVKSSFNELVPSALSKLQYQWKDIKLLIIDEKSMIGRTMAGKMDSRLRQILGDDVMGGIGVLLFGDFAQLPPVGDSPLYSSKTPLKPLPIVGRDVYFSFNQSITLQQIFRQQGDDPTSQQFRDLLLRQRTYSITQEDYNFLSTRFALNVPDEERHTFHDAVHLFPTRADVEDHNHHYLESTNFPVLRCKARHSGGRQAKQATEDQAEGLEAELLLAVGARVMLTRNIWTDRGIYSLLCYYYCANFNNPGLVNGTRATIKQIVFASGADHKIDLPRFIMLEVDRYTGMF
jgi:ATP-dependent DNA helicase PIF1